MVEMAIEDNGPALSDQGAVGVNGPGIEPAALTLSFGVPATGLSWRLWDRPRSEGPIVRGLKRRREHVLVTKIPILTTAPRSRWRTTG
jgi:hypothetical protein